MKGHADLKCLPVSEKDNKVCIEICIKELRGNENEVTGKINDIICPNCQKPRAWTHLKDARTIICNRENNCCNSYLPSLFPDRFPKDPNYKPPPRQKKKTEIIFGDPVEAEKKALKLLGQRIPYETASSEQELREIMEESEEKVIEYFKKLNLDSKMFDYNGKTYYAWKDQNKFDELGA
ncbi:MAG: hypothetical protein EBU35_11615, partial [Marivivens sp.]|nr:hypothetical protein [Marivivens sp.]